MKQDEFAFLNLQLAAMLRDGIPLEGALRRLCQDLRRGPLRSELEKLEADLARGTPLEKALADRQLPELYQRLLLVGAKSNDMPGVLNLLADYYQRQHNLWTRLQGLMVYPVIVLFAAFGVSLLFYVTWGRLISKTVGVTFGGLFDQTQLPAFTRATLPLMENLWVFPLILGLLCGGTVLLLWLPGWRQQARWRLPAFREASLAQAGATLGLLLKGGLSLPEAVGLLERLEPNAKIRRELAAWSHNLAAGMAKFSAVAAGSRSFPPLFVWLVSSAGEDLATGFQHAAEIYQGRAAHRAEVLLYAALPFMVLLLAVVVLSQGGLLINEFLLFVQLFNGVGGLD